LAPLRAPGFVEDSQVLRSAAIQGTELPLTEGLEPTQTKPAFFDRAKYRSMQAVVNQFCCSADDAIRSAAAAGQRPTPFFIQEGTRAPLAA
jgi:hypothetical protein